MCAQISARFICNDVLGKFEFFIPIIINRNVKYEGVGNFWGKDIKNLRFQNVSSSSVNFEPTSLISRHYMHIWNCWSHQFKWNWKIKNSVEILDDMIDMKNLCCRKLCTAEFYRRDCSGIFRHIFSKSHCPHRQCSQSHTKRKPTVHKVYVIFRPYGQKLSLKFRYFPSVRTEI